MATSKIDILNKEFTRCLRGYAFSEVDLFIQEVAHTVGQLSEERNAARQQVAVLEAELREHRGREGLLRDTLVNTHKMVEEMKASTQREAQTLLESSEARSTDMISAAQFKADSLLSAAEARAKELTESSMVKADELVEVAQTKVERIVDAAEHKASEILAQANARVAKAHEELTELKRIRGQLEIRIKAVLDSHHKLLDLAVREYEEQEQENLGKISYLPMNKAESDA